MSGQVAQFFARLGCYLYLDTTGPGGTIIIRRLAYRWGSHVMRGYHFQWYGRKGWKWFVKARAARCNKYDPWVIATVGHTSTVMRASMAYANHYPIVEADEMRVLDMAEHAAGMDY